jgi:hypothetical protein
MSPVSLQPRTHRVSAFEQHELLKREGNTSKVHMHDSGTGGSSTPSKVEELHFARRGGDHALSRREGREWFELLTLVV